MDCPSEERMVRLALEPQVDIRKLSFDLNQKKVEVIHVHDSARILSALQPLNYGARLESSQEHRLSSEDLEEDLDPVKESKVLKTLLVINGGMFCVEIILGVVAESMGLIADSLDMFADAAVYGMSLYAVGKTLQMKKKAAQLSGYIQMLLALGAFIEVSRRFMYGSQPEGLLMIAVATAALVANVSCMGILAKHRQGEVHMKASWIFSTNDVIANSGVILAGVFVYFFQTQVPDLIIGGIVAAIVLRGSLAILKISKA